MKVSGFDNEGASGRFHAAGFEVAVQGRGSLRAAFDEIAGTATGALDEPGKIFGPLYTQLARDYQNEPGFDPFRDILRECILDYWPRASGEVVLGQVVPERRLHSLVTAAAETGIGAQVLEHFLIEAGALVGDDSRPNSRKLFDAKAYGALLEELPTLVGPNAMRAAIGATRQELVVLAQEGLLTPRTKVEKVKIPWRISDGIALVKELSANAVPVEAGSNDWETLLHACKRREVALVDLVTEIRGQRLNVGLRAGVAGFHGVVVRKSEVNLIAPPRNAIRDEAVDDISGTMAAADFGRSVGLRDGGTFLALVETGHVPARMVVNPRSGRPQYRMTPKDMAVFHRRFVTLTTLSAETGQHRNTLKGVLASGGIAPFTSGDQSFGRCICE